MKAIRIERPGEAAIVDRSVGEPGENEVLIKVEASGICGTDVHIFRGEYVGGYPVIPGHEFAGLVERTGPGVHRIRSGDRVTVEPNIACDNCPACHHNCQNFCHNWQGIGVTLPGGMAQYVTAPEKAVFSIGDLPYEQGAFAEPLSCVLHGLERAKTRVADRVAILGSGPIGLLLLQCVRLEGASHVTVVERQEARAEFAKAYNADSVLTDLDALQPESYDVVIDATGVPSVMARSLDFARRGGTVLLFGVPPNDASMQLAPFPIFYNGLTILSSFTSVRNSLQAIALLRSSRVDVSGLISHRLPLSEFERGVTLIEKGLDAVKKVMILPQE